jgi:hypothetical protein
MEVSSIDDFAYDAELTKICMCEEAWLCKGLIYVWSVDSVGSSGEEISVSAARSVISAIVPGEHCERAREKGLMRDTKSFAILLKKHHGNRTCVLRQRWDQLSA